MWAALYGIYAPTIYPAMQIVKPTLARFYRVAAFISLLLFFIYIFIPPHLFPCVGGLYNCLSMSLFPLDYCIGVRQPGINTEARIKRRHSVKTGDYVSIRIKDTHRAILCDARPLPVLFNKNANNSDNANPYIRDRVLHSSRIFFLLYIYFFYANQRTVNFAKRVSITILNIFIIVKILFYLNESQEMQIDTMENVHWMIDRTSFKLRDQWSASMQINLNLIDYLSLFSFDSKESD